MKKIIAFICVACMLCTLMIPVGATSEPQALIVAAEGELTIFNALDVLAHVAGIRDFSAEKIATFDYNNDGEVNIMDALFVLKKLVGMD